MSGYVKYDAFDVVTNKYFSQIKHLQNGLSGIVTNWIAFQNVLDGRNLKRKKYVDNLSELD